MVADPVVGEPGDHEPDEGHDGLGDGDDTPGEGDDTPGEDGGAANNDADLAALPGSAAGWPYDAGLAGGCGTELGTAGALLEGCGLTLVAVSDEAAGRVASISGVGPGVALAQIDVPTVLVLASPNAGAGLVSGALDGVAGSALAQPA